jgi:hypothetical protein
MNDILRNQMMNDYRSSFSSPGSSSGGGGSALSASGDNSDTGGGWTARGAAGGSHLDVGQLLADMFGENFLTFPMMPEIGENLLAGLENIVDGLFNKLGVNITGKFMGINLETMPFGNLKAEVSPLTKFKMQGAPAIPFSTQGGTGRSA